MVKSRYIIYLLASMMDIKGFQLKNGQIILFWERLNFKRKIFFPLEKEFPFFSVGLCPNKILSFKKCQLKKKRKCNQKYFLSIYCSQDILAWWTYVPNLYNWHLFIEEILPNETLSHRPVPSVFLDHCFCSEPWELFSGMIFQLGFGKGRMIFFAHAKYRNKIEFERKKTGRIFLGKKNLMSSFISFENVKSSLKNFSKIFLRKNFLLTR